MTVAARQGQLRVTTHSNGAAPAVTVAPFYMLGLDLPPPPLFQDVMEKSIIPQVALSACLSKYDGVTEHDVPRGGRKTYAVEALPPYLILHMKRFTRNNFFVEKNPTIVTFPVRNLELRDTLPLPPGLASKYHLVANVCHDGALPCFVCKWLNDSRAVSRQTRRRRLSRAGASCG